MGACYEHLSNVDRWATDEGLRARSWADGVWLAKFAFPSLTERVSCDGLVCGRTRQSRNENAHPPIMVVRVHIE